MIRMSKINESILKILQKGHTVSVAQVLDLGLSRALLSFYVKQGLLVRVKQGVYMLPSAIEDDLYTLSLRSSKIIFSHETALFLNNLSERTPFKHSVTIPSNFRLSKKTLQQCNCYYIKPTLHKLGLIQRKTTFGHIVPCYNSERTICDLLRSQSRCDTETLLAALKNFASNPQKDINLLIQYAKKLHVFKQLTPYMEVLL